MKNMMLIILALLCIQGSPWCLKHTIAQSDKIQCLDYSEDGTKFALGLIDEDVNVYEASNQIKIGTYKWAGKKATHLQFNSAKTILAVAYPDSIVKLVNLTVMPYTATNLNTGHGIVNKLNFNSDSSLLLTCGDDNFFKLWSTTNWGSAGSSQNIGQQVKSCKFTFDNKVLAGLADGRVILYQSPYQNANNVGAAIDYGNRINCLALRQGTLKYIVAEQSGKGCVSPSTTAHYSSAGNELFYVSYAKTNDYFSFAGAKKEVAIYNGTNEVNTLLQVLTNPTDTIQCTDFSDDGQYLLVGSDDKNAYIYSTACIQCSFGMFYDLATSQCKLCQSQIEGCGTCTSGIRCFSCKVGHYLNSAGACIVCNSILLGCASCSSDTFCYSCLTGYYYNSVAHTCHDCSVISPGCLNCINGTNCILCHSDYYLSGTTHKCVSCVGISHCLKCSSETACIQCEIGYTLNVNSCAKCATGCLACEGAVCNECSIGYFSNAGVCTQCTSGCIACNQTNFCLNCKAGTYQTAAGLCQTCSAQCVTCNLSGCLSCLVGYYLDASVCKLCPIGCSSCNSTSYCFSCLSPEYHMPTANTCVKCSVTYPSCLYCNNTKCLQCQNGLFYDFGGTNTCKACSVPMHACISCDDVDSCLYCGIGHYLKVVTGNDGNNSCVLCPVGCEICENSSVCTSCAPGYYSNGSSVCVQCSGLCFTCWSQTECQSCVVGYYLKNIASGLCEPCSIPLPFCTYCMYNTTNNLVCSDCGIGHYLSSLDGECKPCPGHCATCLNNTVCVSCELGYYLDVDTCSPCHPSCTSCNASNECLSCWHGTFLSSANKTCSLCEEVINNCISCLSDQWCESCAVGYYLSASNQSCQFCGDAISQCLHCESDLTCSLCSNNNILNFGNTSCTSCSSLITGCLECNSSTSCLACITGYFLKSDYSCELCDHRCLVCENSTFCYQCESGSYLSNVTKQCELCAAQIRACSLCDNTGSTCYSCESKYYLDSGKCKECWVTMDGCSLCNESSLCLDCDSGYYLSSGACFACTIINGCSLCSDSLTCLSCQSGYYLNGGNCLLCLNMEPGCLFCSGNAGNQCSKCQSGYHLQPVTLGSSYGSCVFCSSVLEACIFCSSNTTCLQCQGGFYLNSSTFKCERCDMKGCEVCRETNSTYCLTCNGGYYMSSDGVCSLCLDSIAGCLNCDAVPSCLQCNVGYYLNGASSCTLCSSTLTGCSICSSSTNCLQCKSMYYLDTLSSPTTCLLCSATLTGCAFCTNRTVCISCQSGYFKNSSSLCQPCTNLAGCLVCSSSTTCLFCDTGFYFSAFQCLKCDLVIDGCYSCISNSICASCMGGFELTATGTCKILELTAQAEEEIDDIILKTFYLNSTVLRHHLYVIGTNFEKINISSVDWAANANLFVKEASGRVINLSILAVEWGQNAYTLIFYTNNPLNISESISSMPFTRRMLASSFELSSKTGIQMTEALVQQILPNYAHTGSLTVKYDLQGSQFYASYVKQTGNSLLSVIGGVIVGVLFLLYSIKAIWTVPNSLNLGNIIPHILALKFGALILFPTYIEYVHYCKGFMYADAPWLNAYFGETLSDARDITPPPYSIFYVNMNVASTYLLALCIIIFLATVTFLIGKSCAQEHKMYSYFSFLYCFFSFGVICAGCASLEGAVLNPIEEISTNAAFYILGVFLYFIAFCECLFRLHQSLSNNFWKLRALIKATILSLAHLSPIYLLASAVVIDFILIGVEYKVSQYPRRYPISWFFAQISCNISLVLLVFVPIIKLSLVIVSSLIGLAIVAEMYMHYQQYKVSDKTPRQEEKEKKSHSSANIWIEAEQKFKQEKRHETNESLNNTNHDNIETFYLQGEEENDIKQPYLKSTKTKARNRNYKKVRQAQKDVLRLDRVENIILVSDRKQMNSQSLTFRMDELSNE